MGILILVVLVVIGVGVGASWIADLRLESQKYLELKPKLDNLERAIQEHHRAVESYNVRLAQNETELQTRAQAWAEKVQNDKEEIQIIAKQKTMGFPWLAGAYADYFAMKDGELEEFLKHKKHPAYTAAEHVKQIKEEKRALLRDSKTARYQIAYLKNLFPWISELITENEDDEVPVRIEDDEESGDDEVRYLLTPEEYKSLSSVDRNQLALDRYIESRNKSRWAIGRDYEMYVGHLYERDGYRVEYKGILDGFEDLGRDIIARKENSTQIIQCKHWAQYKEIHEKHVFQLFGTTMEYWIKFFSRDRPASFEDLAKSLTEERLRSVFFTSTRLSDKAKEVARALNVEIRESEPLGEFPRIKCNVHTDEFGCVTKIYHLPMDQQYDRTVIGNRSGEFYAFTVKEAEDAGFRRAFKHIF